MPPILFLNGPNANLYGLGRTATYGTETFADIAARCQAMAVQCGLLLDFRQSNDEGQLIDWIQQARGVFDGILINGAGLSYTSIAIMDALLCFDGPIIEVHMSNIHRREPFRDKTFLSLAATGSICGLGPLGYELAIRAIAGMLKANPS